MMKVYTGTNTTDGREVIFEKEKPYISKTKSSECKNEGCTNKRANGSSRCETHKKNV